MFATSPNAKKMLETIEIKNAVDKMKEGRVGVRLIFTHSQPMVINHFRPHNYDEWLDIMDQIVAVKNPVHQSLIFTRFTKFGPK